MFQILKMGHMISRLFFYKCLGNTIISLIIFTEIQESLFKLLYIFLVTNNKILRRETNIVVNILTILTLIV